MPLRENLIHTPVRGGNIRAKTTRAEDASSAVVAAKAAATAVSTAFTGLTNPKRIPPRRHLGPFSLQVYNLNVKSSV